MKTTFLNNEAAQISGATSRQVQSWTEKGLVRSVNENGLCQGRKRLYDFRGLVELRLVNTLFESGIGLRGIKYILNRVHDLVMLPSKDGPITIELSDLCSISINIDRIKAFIIHRMSSHEST